MSPVAHKIYIFTLSSIVVITGIYLSVIGYSYYITPLEERFYHPQHEMFEPSGLYGHGLGIIGTLLILIGVVMYIVRKRYRFMDKLGRLKYWLEFHIFLCSLGPLMVLFHTAFKFGGIVSIAFWSMVAVVASGVIGRFIYVQIPRSIEGRALNLHEIEAMKVNLEQLLKSNYQLDEKTSRHIHEATLHAADMFGGSLISNIINKHLDDRKKLNNIRKELINNNLPKKEIKKVITLIGNELSLQNRIGRLQTMQKLFRYWHVAHLPFALIMLIIVVIHVLITVSFGATWIF
jgi:hypothetical protein